MIDPDGKVFIFQETLDQILSFFWGVVAHWALAVCANGSIFAEALLKDSCALNFVRGRVCNLYSVLLANLQGAARDPLQGLNVWLHATHAVDNDDVRS